MIGLIKKDFYTIKGNLKTLGIVLVVFAALAYFGEIDLSMMAPFLAVALFISTFNYDEFNHFDIYGITLPKGRRDIVKAKYISGLIMTLISIVFSLMIGFIVSLNTNEKVDLETMYACLISTLIVVALIVPLIFKFGAEKGRIAIFVLVYGIIFSIFAFVKYNIFKISVGVLEFLNDNWKILFTSTAMILLVGSYFLSKRFYKKREY